MPTINYPNIPLIITNGNTGTSITSTSITTPSLITTSIIGSNIGSTGNILSKNDISLIWINPSVTGIDSTNLNMNNNNIYNVNTLTCTNLNATTISSTTTFSNQTTFNIEPISTNPINTNQLATKSYIDGITGQNQNFYLNYSLTPSFTIGTTGYRSLRKQMVSDVSANITTTLSTVVGASTPVISFITDELNITTIPSCLFTAYIFGSVSVATDVRNYYFTLEKYDGITITPIQSNNISSYSYDINSISTVGPTPGCYILNLTIPIPIQISNTDRLIFNLYGYNRSGTTPVTLTTYFHDTTYSYINLQISRPNINIISTSATKNINVSSIRSNYNNLSITTPSKTLILGTDTSTTNFITSGIINIGITGNNTNSIFLGGQINPTYTTMISSGPSSGSIGQVIDASISTVFSTTSPGVGNFTSNYNLISAGVWIVYANQSILRNTTPSTNITSITATLTNTTSNILISMFKTTATYLHTELGGSNYGDLRTCSGIVVLTGNNNIQFKIDLTFVAGTTFTSPSSMFRFVRVA